MKIEMDLCCEVAHPLAEFTPDFCDNPNVHKYFGTTAGVTLDFLKSTHQYQAVGQTRFVCMYDMK